LIIVGDRRVLETGAKIADIALDLEIVGLDTPLANSDQQGTRSRLVDLANLDPETIKIGQISESGAAATLENFNTALALGASGYAVNLAVYAALLAAKGEGGMIEVEEVDPLPDLGCRGALFTSPERVGLC